MLALEQPIDVGELGQDLKTLVEDYERRLIVAALGACDGQQNRAAALLGVLPTTLHEKMKRLGIHRAFGNLPMPGSQTVVLAQPSHEFRWAGDLRRGSVVEVRGTMGRVRAIGVEGDAAEVVAVRSAGPAPGQVAVNVLEDGSGVVFAVHHTRAPGPERTVGSRERAASVLGRMRVDFELRLPSSVDLTARVYSGNIEVVGITGRVTAHTTNGAVHIAQADPLRVA